MPEFNVISKQFVDALLSMDVKKGGLLLKSQSRTESDLLPVEDVVIPALEDIGQAWEEGRISLSQVYMAGRICERLVNEVLPADRPSQYDRPRMAIAVIEDYHALGKRMVISALRSSGYNLLDYGHGLKAAQLTEMVQRDQVDVLFISCLMLASAVRIKDVVGGLEEIGSGTLVVVGGAPFRLAPSLWKEVGAHYMGRNSNEAVKIVKNLMETRVWE